MRKTLIILSIFAILFSCSKDIAESYEDNTIDNIKSIVNNAKFDYHTKFNKLYHYSDFLSEPQWDNYEVLNGSDSIISIVIPFEDVGKRTRSFLVVSKLEGSDDLISYLRIIEKDSLQSNDLKSNEINNKMLWVNSDEIYKGYIENDMFITIADLTIPDNNNHLKSYYCQGSCHDGGWIGEVVVYPDYNYWFPYIPSWQSGMMGGGSGGSSPTNVQPEKRTDCDEDGANKRANNARIITNHSKSISGYDQMKGLSVSSDVEYSARIDYDGSGYVMSSINRGGQNAADVTVNNTTMYALHTHTLEGEPPSPTDFNTSIQINKVLYERYGYQQYNLQGAIVINDKTEYLISIVDHKISYNFSIGQNKDLFKDAADVKRVFENKVIDQEFSSIAEGLYKSGYTDPETNYAYTMAFLLTKYNTGLTLSMKKRNESSFKEIKTTYERTYAKYKPTICP